MKTRILTAAALAAGFVATATPAQAQGSVPADPGLSCRDQNPRQHGRVEWEHPVKDTHPGRGHQPAPAPAPAPEPIPAPQTPTPAPVPEPDAPSTPDPVTQTPTVTVPVSTPTTLLSAEAQTVLDGHNAFRATQGLPPLTYSPQLSEVAQSWSEGMAASQTMVHNPDYAAQTPAGWTAVGENIAWNYGQGAGSAAYAVQQWITSPPHAANMLGAYTHVGIGVTPLPNGAVYYTTNFAAY